MNAINTVEAALIAHGSSKRNGNWNCPGPLHDGGDARPSLHLTSDRRGVGMTCHVGCTVAQICDALGLATKDLFDEPAPRKEVERYAYRSGDGTVLFAKIRYEPKDFSIWHPNGNGWEKGIGDAPKVLYRLPDVQEAILRDDPIYVVEGEKDANRLWSIGAAATCNFEGASIGRPKWRPEYSEMLAGADVIVIADRDDVGYAHALAVKESLQPHARSVRVMQSRTDGKGDDVSDHLDAGFTLEQLLPVTRGRAYKMVDLAAVVEAGVPAPELLCGDMIYAGGLHCIAGAPDCGKTTLALWWALSLLQQGRRVLFLDEEGGQEIVAEKMNSFGAEPKDLRNLMYVPFPGRSWTDEDIAGLCDLADDYEPAMLLIDSSAAFMARAGLDENVAGDVTKWWSRVLSPVARDYGAAVVVIDHDTKATEQSRYARGSGAKLAGLDVQFKVEMVRAFTRHENGILKVNVSKDRRGFLFRRWRVEVETGNGRILPVFEQDGRPQFEEWAPAKRKAYGVLSKNDLKTRTEIKAAIDAAFPDEHPGIALDTITRELGELLREGMVAKIGRSSPGNEPKWRRTS